jgi:alpha-1,6-mannosyltransferase
MNRLSASLRSGYLNRLSTWFHTGWDLPLLFVAVYVFAFPVPFPLLAWYNIPKTSFASIANHQSLAGVVLAVVALVLVLLYRQIWMVAREQPDKFTAVLIVAGWLGASAALLMTFPGQSSDLGDYTFRAHMIAHMGTNPLVTPPSAIVTLEQYPYIGWFIDTDPYGPLWHGLATVTHILAGEDFLYNILGFKLLAILATGLTGWLVYMTTRRIIPKAALAATALWLWNPLVLNEGALHGHNDLVLITFMMMGLWLLLRGNGALGLVALVASGLVKVNAWILLPVAILWLIRREGLRKAWMPIVSALIASAVIVKLAYMPLGGWELLPGLVQNRSWWPTGTLTAAVFFWVRDTLHWPHDWMVSWIARGATLVFFEAAALLALRIRDLRLGAWAVVLAYLLIGSIWFQPWYATWLIPLAAIVFRRKIVAYTLVFTFFMLLHPVVAQFIAVPLSLPSGLYDGVMAAVLIVPQALALRMLFRSMKFRRVGSGSGELGMLKEVEGHRP